MIFKKATNIDYPFMDKKITNIDIFWKISLVHDNLQNF